jgi:hypothetical protein
MFAQWSSYFSFHGVERMVTASITHGTAIPHRGWWLGQMLEQLLVQHIGAHVPIQQLRLVWTSRSRHSVARSSVPEDVNAAVSQLAARIRAMLVWFC